MAEPFVKLASQIKTVFKNLPAGKRIALLTLVCITILGFVFIITWSGKEELGLLYSNLQPSDASAIVEKLKERQMPYQLNNQGTSILVPRSLLYELRMEMASQGLPQGSGVGFEIFDNTKLGMTEFVQNVNYQRAIQGEIARTINGITEIENSRVHIVMATKSLFVEDEEPATASVVLKLHPGKSLSKQQVKGIVHLVSSSISGLAPGNVTVVDHNGKLLAGMEGESSYAKVSTEQFAYKERIERNLENKIRSMLETALGSGKAIVRVSCDLDFMRQEKTEEMFLPENQVVRSEKQLNTESTGSALSAAGIPGVVSNMSAGKAGVAEAGTMGPSSYKKQDKTMNYEIGKITSHKIMPTAELRNISAAVLVDGTYVQKTLKDGSVQSEYTPRTDDEMTKIETIVKSALNFDAQRGDTVEVANMPFQPDPWAQSDETAEGGWLSRLNQYGSLIKIVLALLFMLLGFLFLVRPIVKWLTSVDAGSDVEILKQLPKTVGEIENEMGAESQSLPFRDRAIDMLMNDNNASMGLMRDWLNDSQSAS
jgi:flagellar M-ring protein FliF